MMLLEYSAMALLIVVLCLSASCRAAAAPEVKEKSVLEFKVEDIDGKEVDLSRYKGKVLLIVNVASKCGFTKQYAALQEIFEKYQDQGFMILGFPANNFMRQEPGTNEEIKSFCTLTYNVSFDMFAKISVRGKDKAPIYEYLTSKKANHDFGGAIKWNFNKFLIGRDGRVINRFGSREAPKDAAVIAAIEAALKEEAPKATS